MHQNNGDDGTLQAEDEGTATAQQVRDYRIDFTRLLYMQHLEIDNLILRADTKAQLILGVNAVLIAALSSGLSLRSQLVALEGLVMLLLVLSVYFALITVRPRFKKGNKDGSLFFFGDIMRMTNSSYIDAYMDLSLQEVKAAVMGQIHAKSSIVHKKYSNVRYSVTFLLLALFVWALAWGISTVMVM